MNLRAAFAFPLLAKELTERAARPRTYWMRILGGTLLFLAFWSDNRWLLREAIDSPASILGAGERMFESLTWMLLAGIYAFVPAMLCGAVTQEKERDSLALLLLTELRPWQIVVQKYIAGLVPALSLLLLAMPLGAVAYAYGGFTARSLAFTLLILVLATLQIAALALWCSCRFRTTVAAFLGTYALAALLVLVPALPVILEDALNKHWFPVRVEWWFFAHVPPAVLDTARAHTLGPLAIAATTLLFLFLAARDLPRRAFLPARPWLREFFGRIDRFMARVNRCVGSIAFRRKAGSLPLGEPVLWRETRARALARPEYLVRLLLAVEIPTLIAASLMSTPSFGRQLFELSLLGAIAGIVAVLVLSVTAANAFVTERVNQTLDVLLTTPLTGRDIVRQKARALRPLTWVLAVPLITIFGLEGWIEEITPWTGYAETLGLRTPSETWLQYIIGSALTVAICLPLVGWLSLWIGLWCRTRLRAIVTTLVVILAWSFGPFMLLEALDIDLVRRSAERWLWLASPLTYPSSNELGELRQFGDNAWVPLVVNFALYGGALWLIRRHCLWKADAYLRR